MWIDTKRSSWKPSLPSCCCFWNTSNSTTFIRWGCYTRVISKSRISCNCIIYFPKYLRGLKQLFISFLLFHVDGRKWQNVFCLCVLISQFEYMAQHLVFANCIPLILKFFNQNIMSYITAKNRYGHGLFEWQKSWLPFTGNVSFLYFLSFPNSISVLDFPYCVVHELPELTAESLVRFLMIYSCVWVLLWLLMSKLKSF